MIGGKIPVVSWHKRAAPVVIGGDWCGPPFVRLGNNFILRGQNDDPHRKKRDNFLAGIYDLNRCFYSSIIGRQQGRTGGTRETVPCSNCGADMRAGDKFCASCGTSAPTPPTTPPPLLNPSASNCA